MQRIRTLSEIEFKFSLFTEQLFLYQEIGSQVNKLYLLGFSYSEIGKALSIDSKTAKKAIDFIKQNSTLLN